HSSHTRTRCILVARQDPPRSSRATQPWKPPASGPCIRPFPSRASLLPTASVSPPLSFDPADGRTRKLSRSAPPFVLPEQPHPGPESHPHYSGTTLQPHPTAQRSVTRLIQTPVAPFRTCERAKSEVQTSAQELETRTAPVYSRLLPA